MNNFPSIKQVESKVHSNLNSLKMIKTYTNYIVNNQQCIKIEKKISPAKRIEPAPQACQPIAITTTPPLYCTEGLTGLNSLGACENLDFQNSISRNN